MAWTIEFSQQATRQLERLDKPVAKRIWRFLTDRLATADDPRALGKPLQGVEWRGYWRLRVGDYRLVAEIRDGKLTIVVVEIGHRSDIYR